MTNEIENASGTCNQNCACVSPAETCGCGADCRCGAACDGAE
jgi:hypothetical protein